MNEQAEKQFNRVKISADDFTEALQYLDELGKSDQSETVKRALLVAAIVAYSRPFTNHQNNEEACNQLPINPKKMLCNKGYSLHLNVMEIRNKAVAHSDFETNPTTRTDTWNGGFGVRYYLFDPRKHITDIDLFKAITDTMKLHCTAKLHQLNEQF